MSDILYPMSVCGSLFVLAKRDFQLVAFNESGQQPAQMTPLDEIGYSTVDNINRVTSVKPFSDNRYAPKKRNADMRELREVQNAQLALELERYLRSTEKSFVIEELNPAWYPIKMLADVLRNHSEYDLSEINLVQLAADMVFHADSLIRQNLERSELELPVAKLTISDNSPNSSIPATRLALSYFEQVMSDYSKAHSESVKWRVRELGAWNPSF